MKTDDILKLINAGYTKEDIEAMDVAVEAPAVEKKVEVKEEPKEQPKSELQLLAEQITALTKIVMENKVAKDEPTEDVAAKKEDPKADNAVIEEIRKMREAMQASNILTSQQEEPMTTEKALSSIING